jgi:transposase, IS5 family
MRQVIDPQLSLGELDIAAIVIDAKSRDDIPRILRGLQHIYTDAPTRERVFAILAEILPRHALGEDPVSPDTGRPGMEQWKILVLGTLRLGLNADDDRTQELANQHATVRRMLGHSDWADDTYYSLQRIEDNLRLFTPEILDRINREVVGAGHRLVKKTPDAGLEVRCDSFVVETDVHYPTDINLLLDATRKSVETCAQLCDSAGLTDWRQSAYNVGCHRCVPQLWNGRVCVLPHA